MPADRPAQERGEGIRRWTIPVCAVHGYVPNYCICTEDPELVKRVTRVVVADEQAVRREALREAAEKLRAADDLLRRLDEWDVMHVTGDGP